jgi:hypothetical protein
LAAYVDGLAVPLKRQAVSRRSPEAHSGQRRADEEDGAAVVVVERLSALRT